MSLNSKILELPSIKETLKKNRIFPKKSLGQNFILDLNITNKIAKSISCHQKNIIEVGPGPGSLTRSVLNYGANSVIAIEKDIKMMRCLNELKKISGDKLTLINNDILSLSLDNLGPFPKTIIGNLPYNISSKLITSWLKEIFLNNNILIENIIITVQKELADRLVADENSKKYGRLSVFTKLLSNIDKIFVLAPENFYPKPKVVSSVIKITPLEKPRFNVNLFTFEKVIRHAFGNRRKTLRQSLKVLGGVKLLDIAGINNGLRAENLSLKDYCNLSNIIDKNLCT